MPRQFHHILFSWSVTYPLKKYTRPALRFAAKKLLLLGLVLSNQFLVFKCHYAKIYARRNVTFITIGDAQTAYFSYLSQSIFNTFLWTCTRKITFLKNRSVLNKGPLIISTKVNHSIIQTMTFWPESDQQTLTASNKLGFMTDYYYHNYFVLNLRPRHFFP